MNYSFISVATNSNSVMEFMNFIRTYITEQICHIIECYNTTYY